MSELMANGLGRLNEDELKEWFDQRLIFRTCSIYANDPDLPEAPEAGILQNYLLFKSATKEGLRRACWCALINLVRDPNSPWRKEHGFPLLRCLVRFYDGKTEDLPEVWALLKVVLATPSDFGTVYKWVFDALDGLKGNLEAEKVDRILIRIDRKQFEYYLIPAFGFYLRNAGLETIFLRLSSRSPLRFPPKFEWSRIVDAFEGQRNTIRALSSFELAFELWEAAKRFGYDPACAAAIQQGLKSVYQIESTEPETKVNDSETLPTVIPRWRNS